MAAAHVTFEASELLSRDMEIDRLRREVERLKSYEALRDAAEARRAGARDSAVEDLLREVTWLRTHLEGSEAAKRHGVLLRRLIEDNQDATSAFQVIELQKALDAMTTDRNRLQAEVNRLRAAHSDEVEALKASHERAVHVMQSKMMKLNDALHELKGFRLVQRLAAYKKEIFELKEALFVMREQMTAFTSGLSVQEPFAAAQDAMAKLAEANEVLRKERNEALQFVQTVRVAVSDLWNGIPRLDDLRMNLGRKADPTRLLEAIRRLTDRYMDVITAKGVPVASAVQCDIGPSVVSAAPAPKPPVTRRGCQTPAEWMRVDPPRRQSTLPDKRRSTTVRVINKRASSVKVPAASLRVPDKGASLRPWSRATSVTSEKSQPWSTVSMTDDRRVSNGDDDDDIAAPASPSDGNAFVVAPFDTGVNADGDDTESKSTPSEVVVEVDMDTAEDCLKLIDDFRRSQLRRMSMQTWLRRFKHRQLRRLERLIVDRHLNAPARPPSGKAMTPRPPPSTATTVKKPSQVGNVLNASASRTDEAPSVPAATGAAAPRLDQQDVQEADKPSVLSTFMGAGWRYGHVRTVAPSHVPKQRPHSARHSSQRVEMDDAEQLTAVRLETQREIAERGIDIRQANAARTPRDPVASRIVTYTARPPSGSS